MKRNTLLVIVLLLVVAATAAGQVLVRDNVMRPPTYHVQPSAQPVRVVELPVLSEDGGRVKPLMFSVTAIHWAQPINVTVYPGGDRADPRKHYASLIDAIGWHHVTVNLEYHELVAKLRQHGWGVEDDSTATVWRPDGDLGVYAPEAP